MDIDSLPPLPLPQGITESYVDCTSSCGLNFHILKSGARGDPLVLFCHGFPELAYSWRKLLPKISQAGFWCVAMDQRGYGRTTGWARRPYQDVDLNDFSFTNLVRDLVCLVYGLGYTEVYSIVGHDFGAVSSAMAALMRPDMFRSTVQLSHPHHAPPAPELGHRPMLELWTTPAKVDIQAELAGLSPPRKHYKWYNSSPQAAEDWDNPPQGLEEFLRGYFYLKSADWERNDPQPLRAWDAKSLEVMPEYYIMQKDRSMPETVRDNLKGEDTTKTGSWLTAEDLQVYCDEWKRVGFQGALNWYRSHIASTPQSARDMLLFSGKRIEVPCAFIGGDKDWANYQQPGALESYNNERVVKKGCLKAVELIPGAGHWVQQEQPEKVIEALFEVFLQL